MNEREHMRDDMLALIAQGPCIMIIMDFEL